MKAAVVCFTVPLPLRSTKTPFQRTQTKPRRTIIFPRIKASAAPEASTVDYTSSTSVFPAEACDTVGGEACEVEMFPEVKPPVAQASSSTTRVGVEEVHRDYLDYNEPKTVFPGEACDDLGGEFCQPEYQKGVFEEKTLSK